MTKVNIIPYYFEPTDEFEKVLKGRTYREVMFDSYVTDFIEKHSVTFHGRKICKGRDSTKFMIGFAGCYQVLEADPNRNWVIRYDNMDRAFIQYVSVKIENGFVDMRMVRKFSKGEK